MRFSDMMGSGEERSRQSSESDNAISDVLAPYLDSVVPPAPTTPPETADTAEVADTVETAVAVAVDTATPADAPPPVAPTPPVPAPRTHTVESVFPVIAVEPLPGVGRAEPTDAAPRTPIATELADFTPLSDDLLPHRR